MVSMKEIRQLSVAERILMVVALWDSIEEIPLELVRLPKSKKGTRESTKGI